MPYHELLFRARMITQQENRDERNGMVYASFTAWQIIASQSGSDITWGQYLKKLGLAESRKVSKKAIEREAEASLQKANSILERLGGGHASG